MTDVAYLLFTFLACLSGLGIGLLVHHVWLTTNFAKGPGADPFASSDNETESWEVYARWQAANNRRFAMQVISCGATPLFLAGIAWSQRSDVVHAVCNNVIQTVGQAYICL
jgi:hypothetical protein